MAAGTASSTGSLIYTGAGHTKARREFKLLRNFFVRVSSSSVYRWEAIIASFTTTGTVGMC
jgi:hypothetical protein